jgi:hypothetical protein
VRKKRVQAILVSLGLVLALIGILASRSIFTDPRIEVRWVKAYENESWDDVRTGIAWWLSFLGAALPKGSLDRCITKRDTTHFSLDLSKAGFPPQARRPLQTIVDQLESSEEYRQKGSIDLGRLVVLTLHSSWHYYAVTGAEPTLQAFLGRYGLGSAESFAVVHSGVARDHRVLRIKAASDVRDMAFVAEEGHGSLQEGTFAPVTYEAVAVQTNGQFRFAIYDQAGHLTAASPRELGAAGKPSKCLWCHEIYIHGLVTPTPDVSGYMTGAQFTSLVESCTRTLTAYRQTLSSEIDYDKKQDHSFSEYLYETFMDPPLYRLVNEWNMSLPEVTKRVARLTTHKAEESPTPEPAYHRADVDGLAPYRSVLVPSSVREPSAYEPDLISRTAGR